MQIDSFEQIFDFHESVNSLLLLPFWVQCFLDKLMLCCAYPSFQSFVALTLAFNLLLHSPFSFVALTLSHNGSILSIILWYDSGNLFNDTAEASSRGPWDAEL